MHHFEDSVSRIDNLSHKGRSVLVSNLKSDSEVKAVNVTLTYTQSIGGTVTSKGRKEIKATDY